MLQRQLQLLEVDRLDEIVVRAELQAFDRGARLIDRREHEDREVGILGEDLGEQLHAAGLGHADIAEHRLGMVRRELLQRLGGVRRRLHVIPQAAEETRQRLADAILIIHHEYGRAVRGQLGGSHGRQRC